MGKPLKNLGTATLNIQWPKEISNGKWLLYLVKVESKGLEKLDCEPRSEINFLNLKVCFHRVNKGRELLWGKILPFLRKVTQWHAEF